MRNAIVYALLSLASLVTEAQAPHHYTAYDFVSDMVAQCVKDQECGTDTECMEAESLCIRELAVSQ